MDKHTEDLVKKLYRELDTEQPSSNFTDSVMDKIEAIKPTALSSYKPIISKPMRYILCLGFLALLLFLSFSPNTQGLGWLDQLDWSFIPEFSMKNSFSSVTIPKSIIYAVVLFGVMFWIQIGILKHRHSNQFKV